jgi:hypothetical protein
LYISFFDLEYCEIMPLATTIQDLAFHYQV